ncbi:hypothetical protein [Aurantiacibacter suaedae]|uniref:hypothetical protein n=1 Tax=Aurantiacibacter suaedae TaxID=2545755 RepID=UPI0010F9D00E|nr:hypothetical protein [Aurantiacibacter suaedae]
MIRSDRRTLIKGSMAMAALGAMPTALRARGLKPALFIYDARFAASRELAREWAGQGVATLDPREHDLGLAWRGPIPQLLANGGALAGATLWSDRFICESFARDHGRRQLLHDTPLPDTGGAALRHWAVA